MNGAAGESLWPVMAGTKWIRIFHAMVATPVGPSDVFLGVVTWTGVRAAVGAHDLPDRRGAARRRALVVGAARDPGRGADRARVRRAAHRVRRDPGHRLPVPGRSCGSAIIPLFLFSGTLFPVSQLPDWLQPLCWFSPLWHGVQLCRGATTGSIDALEAVANVAVLVRHRRSPGALWGIRTFTRKLAT